MTKKFVFVLPDVDQVVVKVLPMSSDVLGQQEQAMSKADALEITDVVSSDSDGAGSPRDNAVKSVYSGPRGATLPSPSK